MSKIMGISLANGIAMGSIIRIENAILPITFQETTDKENEKYRARKGFEKALKYQQKVIDNYNGNSTVKDVLKSYFYMINDPDLLTKIDTIIDSVNCIAEYAVKTVFEQAISSLSICTDEYLKSRDEDLNNVMNRVIRMISDKYSITDDIDIKPGSIIAIENITPTHFANFDLKNVVGIITSNSGPSSHMAIIAKSELIPTICCSKEDLNRLKNGQLAIIDGTDGVAILNPTNMDMKFFDDKMYNLNIQKEKLIKYKELEGKTNDGIRIPVQANIFTMKDLEAAVAQGAEGIGLVRTELLFANEKEIPSFEEQLKAYCEIIEKAPGNSVVFRTFDFGSDKDYFSIVSEPEENPALGFRAIRIGLKMPQMLHDQLKAILMASTQGEVTILIPMITSPDEVVEVKMKLEEIKAEITSEGKEYNEMIKLGVMIEVPSAAMMADEIACLVDLLSIGTNDLTQYTLAADRSNKYVSDIFNPYHPAVLRLISIISDAGRRNRIPVCVCGEMAAQNYMIKTLVGLGVTQLSVAPQMIQSIKATIDKHTYEEDIIFASTIMNCGSVLEAKAMITSELNDI